MCCNVCVASWQCQHGHCLCSGLGCVAVCRSVSQYVAEYYSVVQFVCCHVAIAVRASPCHCLALLCTLLQCVCCHVAKAVCAVSLQGGAVCCILLKCFAMCMLQCGNSSMRIAFHACVCGLRFCAYIRVYDCFYYCVRVCMCAEMQVGKSSSFSALLGKSETLKKEAGVVSDTVAALKVHLSFYVHAYIYVHV